MREVNKIVSCKFPCNIIKFCLLVTINNLIAQSWCEFACKRKNKSLGDFSAAWKGQFNVNHPWISYSFHMTSHINELFAFSVDLIAVAYWCDYISSRHQRINAPTWFDVLFLSAIVYVPSVIVASQKNLLTVEKYSTRQTIIFDLGKKHDFRKAKNTSGGIFSCASENLFKVQDHQQFTLVHMISNGSEVTQLLH